MKNYRNKFCIFFLIILFHSCSISSQTRQQEVISGTNGMVATAHPLASNAALEILKMGGNAVDAAVAAAFVIGVVEPDGSGLGGGGGMVIYLNDLKEPVYINYYQQASAEIDKLDYNNKTDNRTVKSILIPGTVAGLITALKNYGTLPLSTVIAPAIKCAEEGFPIDGTLAGIILDHIEILQKHPTTASIYLPGGFPLMEGETLVQKDLANTLRVISEKGRDGFYSGEIAEQIISGIRSGGGILTLDDFKNFNAQILKPIIGTYRGYKIYSACEPQSGASVIEALNILENEDLKKLGNYSTNSDALNLIAETFRRVYADRSAFIEDPRFGYIPIDGLTSKEYAHTRYEDLLKGLNESKDYRKTKPGQPENFSVPIDSTIHENEKILEFDGGHTTHLSVIDKDGNMVSLTQTLGTFFGSGYTAAGVLFNNGMMNFSSSSVNHREPNKQPRSSISPTIILKDGKPFMAVGSPGASRVIAAVVEVIVNVIDYGMNTEEANFSPRFFCQKFDDHLYLESRIPENVVEELKEKGHNVQVLGDFDLFFGGVQLITVDPETGIYYGSADPRRGGSAIGY